MTDRPTAGGRSETSADADPDESRRAAHRMLEDTRRESGFCVPNPTTYPWQRCWDSCFHAVTWLSHDEPARAVSELSSLFAGQGEDGFVPHMTYHDDPDAANALWAQSGRSPFDVASASLNALAALDLWELAVLDPDGGWAAAADGLVRSLPSRWDGSTRVDGDHVAADALVLEALLAVPRQQTWTALAVATSVAPLR